MIILIQPNKNGKIELTKEQFQEYLEQAMEEGTREERKRQINRITVNPCAPLSNPNDTGNPLLDWNKFTCNSSAENEIMRTSQMELSPNNSAIKKLAHTQGTHI